jgi:2-hydroxy-3-keto-5-methylthiopentenyl-1-phosphate phosphatase
MEKPQLPPDFKDFLKLCIDHEVRFLVVGGLAVVYHGHPRLTLDLEELPE